MLLILSNFEMSKQIILTMKACPRCKSVSRHRLKRKGFVKMIPGARSYGCDKCNTNYTWFSIINSSLRV